MHIGCRKDIKECKSVLVINNGKSLYRLLDEMIGFEFFITNFETDYLLCFNHHDCLVGCGAALTTVPENRDGRSAKATAYKKGKRR